MKFGLIIVLASFTLFSDAHAGKETLCTQAFIDSYTQAKVHLAAWSTAGSKASDEDVAASCKVLLAAKAEDCKLDCSKLKSDTLCEKQANGTISAKELVEECKSYERRAKTKSI